MLLPATFPLIILAAGIGARMGAKQAKQYIEINGKTILEHTLDVFLSHSRISQIVVVLHPKDDIFHKLPIAQHELITTIIGGDERVDSVLSGLKHLNQMSNKTNENQYVLVHDAARPCIDHTSISQLIEVCENDVGGILAIPVADTIKQAKAENSLIDKTINREKLWQAQTPQMFKLQDLYSAIISAQKKGLNITDEASAMEHSGASVRLVLGTSKNIKVTHPSDLSLATYYLADKEKTI
ncbi:2-C-methyl-D-erythritol 4-phosphate cytidylyltransferase [Glaciecola petra]|uniref:2-C-methyl-D-erythritol 4-phosphate cytidylyltransferase n=1 Tax=Glaciecola petra TaxID=3075602 RepID=A0ABU2ZL07_9ALTE|nr:2-C-methyl-D-erythritol 4-phosphate cytidylyltransferase [Aestuariibacter sp. P117]MDT0593293.1 2-C-methyl-D-erythritol 4-phosphate cytidylyltransferase [Aestuariibacter sp. P117]